MTDTHSNARKLYCDIVLAAYNNGRENAFEHYQRLYPDKEVTDEDSFIISCAEQDFEDGEDCLEYQDLWENYRPFTVANRIKAFVLGMIEFRSDLTTSFDDDLIETYDAGRDMAHKLTLRIWDGAA